MKTAIDRYLTDLRATLNGDIEEARRLLDKGFARIVLRRDEDGHLWAEVRGNGWPAQLEGADRLLELVPEDRPADYRPTFLLPLVARMVS